jgi:cytochrome P450
MSSPKGVAFVLSVALLPPALIVLRSVINPRYLLDTSKTLLGVYAVIYFLALRGITIPYFTSPLRALPQPTGSCGLLSGHGGAEFVQPRGKRYREWIDSIDHNGLIFFRGFLHALQTVVLASPEALYDVLVTNSYDFEKPAPGRALLARTIGNGLINTEGQEHKFQRKGVTPAFSGKHIRDLVPIFWQKSQELFNTIAETQLDTQVSADGTSKTVRTGVVEINQWASRVTLDIIGLACVGRDFGAIRNSEDEFVQQYEKILRTDNTIPIFYAIATILTPLWIARLTPFWKRFREASDGRYQLRRLCKGLIEVKRRDMQTESAKHIDILSVLIRNGQFNDDQLVSQLLTFLAAG